MTGIGVLIILLQIGPLMGHASPTDPLEATLAVPGFLADPHLGAVILALAALAIAFLVPTYLPRVNRLFPAPLMALIVGTAVFMLLMPDSGAPILGAIPTGLPEPQIPIAIVLGAGSLASKHEKVILQEAHGKILLYHVDGPLSFGAARGMVRRLAHFRQFDVLVVDLTDVPVMDFTSGRALDDIIGNAVKINRQVFVVGMRPELKAFLETQGILEKIEPVNIHSQRSTALCTAARSVGLDPAICRPE